MNKVAVIAKDAGRSDRLGGADMTNRVGNQAGEGAKVGAMGDKPPLALAQVVRREV